MTDDAKLDHHDIQGNIIKSYSRDDMPGGRYVFFEVTNGEAGRRFVGQLLSMITTSVPWVRRARGHVSTVPDVATNVAFTFNGLRHLGVPQASLQSFPDEFAMGMRARRELLGDDEASAPERWDPIWTEDSHVDIFVLIHGKTGEAIDTQYRAILALLAKSGVNLLSGHRGDNGATDLPYQEVSSLFLDGAYSQKEHFGYTDGISNPYLRGAETHPANAIGGGKLTGGDVETTAGWDPVETGEFLFGQKDEGFELPDAPTPSLFARNGTYMVYRKLHQNVGSFDAYLEEAGKTFPGGKEALAAKFMGRWRNGAPVTTFPTEKEADEFAREWDDARRAIGRTTTLDERTAAKERFAELNKQFVAFDYRKDPEGSGCPFGGHTRRVHSRGTLERGVRGAFARPDALVVRRRLLRRGITYGESQQDRTDAGNHGFIFIAYCANLQRQFEFVQQQWINYGNDFQLGNDKDPLVGNHETDAQGVSTGRMIVETGTADPNPPFICSKVPRFVETRGGGYFFVPSLTALRMIADGTVDPT